MRPLSLRLYVAAILLLAALAAIALTAISGEGVEREWLIAVFAALIAAEHLFETRLVHEGEQGESTTHEESFLVAMAFLASPPSVVLAFGIGFLAGNVLRRRGAFKTLFNVGTMVLATGVALLVIEGAGGAGSPTVGATLAVLAGATAFVVVNTLTMSVVLALAGSGTVLGNLRDDPAGRALVSAGNVALGLLAGLAAAVHLWTLPFGLAALVALHLAFRGHGRARAEQQKLADLVASSSDGIVSVDRDGRVRSWNPACERITGYEARRVLGLRLSEVERLLESEPEDYPEGIAVLVGGGHGERAFIRIRRRDGETRWLNASRAPLPEGGSVLVLHDETTRRQVDELVAHQERERLKSDLVATVSHELRTPLTSILGFTQTLLSHATDEQSRGRYLEIIRAEGERLGRLIDDLLDLRRASEGLFAIESERLDLGDLLVEEVELFSGQSERHRLVLQLPSERIWVRGDARRLRQVVANLISNAIKYSPAGGDVLVSAGLSGGRARVAVTDTGLGIPVDQQPQVFTRFFRVESPEREEIGGSGLGLALAREIVEAHRGEIGFESSEGRGSTFFFELPASESAAPEPRA